jgi:hypothetical protein
MEYKLPKFYFVAGERVVTRHSRNVLDAFLSLKLYARKNPLASEFHRLPIEAVDAEGNVVGRRTWAEWDKEILRDTYGDDYDEVLENAAKLL